MNVEKKAIELLSQRYHSPIIKLNNNKNHTLKSIVDTRNGALFSFSNAYYSFKDQEGNFWLTLPKTLIINDKEHNPVVGNRYICDGIKYSFRTQDVVIAMAANYFENFIDTDYGLKKKSKWHLFFCERERYVMPYNCFKSQKHKNIKIYISNN